MRKMTQVDCYVTFCKYHDNENMRCNKNQIMDDKDQNRGKVSSLCFDYEARGEDEND